MSEDVLTATSSFSSSVQQKSLKKHKIVSEMSKDIQSEQSCTYVQSNLLSKNLEGHTEYVLLIKGAYVRMCYQYCLTYVASVCGLGTE